MFPRFRFVLLLAIALSWAVDSARAAAEWKVIKVDRWDYLSVENIAQFYGFTGDITPIEKTIRLDNGRNQLEVTLDSREAMVNGVRNWLCFPVIEKDGQYLVSRIDLAKTIEPQFRPHLIKGLRPLKTVVIDAGHGGVEKGAASSYGNEKEFSLDVAKRLQPMLEAKGLRVVMTREGDDMVPLPTRARIANATRDSIFVSIHFNATDRNPEATGFEIYSLTPRGAPSTQDTGLRSHFANMQAGTPVDAASLILSTAVYHSMLGYMPEFDRGVKRARFAVLRLTQVPAILVEGGFLTEREESRLIAKPSWRAQLAQSIAVGIDNYRLLTEKKQRPALLADYRRQLDGVLVARDGNATPSPDAAPPVLPAANYQIGVNSQLTTSAFRAEPDAQPPALEAATESVNDAPAELAAAIVEPPMSEPQDPSESMPAASDLAPAEPTTIEARMPGDAPAPVVAKAPAATVTRTYWVLKLDPPPKFRQ